MKLITRGSEKVKGDYTWGTAFILLVVRAAWRIQVAHVCRVVVEYGNGTRNAFICSSQLYGAGTTGRNKCHSTQNASTLGRWLAVDCESMTAGRILVYDRPDGGRWSAECWSMIDRRIGSSPDRPAKARTPVNPLWSAWKKKHLSGHNPEIPRRSWKTADIKAWPSPDCQRF